MTIILSLPLRLALNQLNKIEWLFKKQQKFESSIQKYTQIMDENVTNNSSLYFQASLLKLTNDLKLFTNYKTPTSEYLWQFTNLKIILILF